MFVHSRIIQLNQQRRRIQNPCQTSKLECFAKIGKNRKMLGVWRGFEYHSEQTLNQVKIKISNEFLSIMSFDNYLHNASTGELH